MTMRHLDLPYGWGLRGMTRKQWKSDVRRYLATKREWENATDAMHKAHLREVMGAARSCLPRQKVPA
jgi:hypothetical protein